MKKQIYFWKRKPRKPSACARRNQPAHTGLILCVHEGFQKHKKVKFFALMLRFGTNPILFGSRSKPLFSQYK